MPRCCFCIPNALPAAWFPTERRIETWVFPDCHSVASSALLDPDGGGSLAVKKILIVEDSYVIAESISRTLVDVGFAVVGPADTADQAMQQIEQDVPDGALLDVTLREGSVVAVANALRGHKVPFVVVTAFARDMLPAELRQAPYLAKPMSEIELIETVRRTFERQSRPIADCGG
jgi:DNA-binding NtrC family response regulator